MKRRLLYLFAVAIAFVSILSAQYRTVTIREIQQVSVQNLQKADSLQLSDNTQWKLQTSPIFNQAVRETVEIVAQVLVPAKVITFTASGWTMLLRDTGTVAHEWSSIFVRANAADSAQLVNNGFLNPERGDIIRIRGYVDEFPANLMYSITQFVPASNASIDIIGAAPPPEYPHKNVSDFFTGVFPGGKIQFLKGEPFESVPVTITNLTVVSILNSGRGTVNLLDEEGNMISTYDASGWFTLQLSTTGGHWHRNPASTYAMPPVNARIDTIRGYISTVSGNEGPRGYRIAPIYPGDMVVGTVLPIAETHRRDSVVVKSTHPVSVSIRAYQQDLNYGNPLKSVYKYHSINHGPWVVDSITTVASDSTYQFTIPAQLAGTFVKYFFKVFDDQYNAVTYANSASGGSQADTGKGFFFYTVKDAPLTIRDVQYTPFTNGRTGYLGASVSLSGIVTADTGDIGMSSLNTAGTTAWYMQTTGERTWGGIWLTGTDSTLPHLRRGDSITVTGTVQENFDVTRLGNIVTPPVVHSTNNPLPEIPVVTTGTFGIGQTNGTPGAEQYEGMVVRVNNVTVSDIYPVFADITEYEVNDGTGAVILRRDGLNNYSNVPGDTLLGKTIIHVGDKFDYVQGAIYFSFNRYKLTPRKDSDFGTLTSMHENVDRETVPSQFSLTQNYPNPFNPVTNIRYALPKASFVTLRVYNILGQEIRLLVNGHRSAGTHTVTFDASGLPSGMYFYMLSGDNFRITKRMMLVK